MWSSDLPLNTKDCSVRVGVAHGSRRCTGKPSEALPQTDEACSGKTLSRHSGARPQGREPGIHNHRSGSMDSGLASASLRRPLNDALTKVDTLAPRILTQAQLEPVPMRSNHLSTVMPALVAGIHVFLVAPQRARRGWPGLARPRLRKSGSI